MTADLATARIALGWIGSVIIAIGLLKFFGFAPIAITHDGLQLAVAGYLLKAV